MRPTLTRLALYTAGLLVAFTLGIAFTLSCADRLGGPLIVLGQRLSNATHPGSVEVIDLEARVERVAGRGKR